MVVGGETPKAKAEKKMCPHLKKPCLEHGCMAWRQIYTTESHPFWDCAIICGAENQAQPFQV